MKTQRGVARISNPSTASSCAAVQLPGSACRDAAGFHPVPRHDLEELTTCLESVGIKPVRHQPGTLAGIGLMWLARS